MRSLLGSIVVIPPFLRNAPVRRSQRLAVATIAAAMTATACAAPEPVFRLPEMDFRDRPEIRLDVATIDVVNNYRMPLQAPNVEHELDMAPAAAAERWARQVLVADGRTGSARFIIRDAAVTETRLPTETGLRGLVTVEASERYTATLDTVIEIDHRAGASARAETRAEHTNSASEDLSLNDRRALWYAMVETLMEAFDAAFRDVAKRKISVFVR